MNELDDTQVVLTKAIQKAIDGGWELSDCSPELVDVDHNLNIKLSYWVDFVDEGMADEAKVIEEWQLQKLIFNHDFAKALWGETKYYLDDHRREPIKKGWKYHLQKMVIADNPIEYLKATMEA